MFRFCSAVELQHQTSNDCSIYVVMFMSFGVKCKDCAAQWQSLYDMFKDDFECWILATRVGLFWPLIFLHGLLLISVLSPNSCGYLSPLHWTRMPFHSGREGPRVSFWGTVEGVINEMGKRALKELLWCYNSIWCDYKAGCCSGGAQLSSLVVHA